MPSQDQPLAYLIHLSTLTLVDGMPGKRRNVRRDISDGREEIGDIVEDRGASRIGRHSVAVGAAEDPVRVIDRHQAAASGLRSGRDKGCEGEEDPPDKSQRQ